MWQNWPGQSLSFSPRKLEPANWRPILSAGQERPLSSSAACGTFALSPSTQIPDNTARRPVRVQYRKLNSTRPGDVFSFLSLFAVALISVGCIEQSDACQIEWRRLVCMFSVLSCVAWHLARRLLFAACHLNREADCSFELSYCAARRCGFFMRRFY